MTSLTPGYGETPVSGEDLNALLPGVRRLLGEPTSKAAIYDLEQAIQEQVTEHLLMAVEQYTWELDKPRYIALLREYDAHRDPRDLADYISVQPLGE